MCVYTLHIFIHSSVDGHLGCFHILAIVNAAKKAGVCICFQITAFFFFSYIPRSTILGHMIVLFLGFWGTSILFSIVVTLIHIPTNSERVPLLLLGLTAVLCFFDFIFQLKFTIPLSSVLNFTGLDLAHDNSCPSEVIWTTFRFTCQANYACLPTCPTAFIVPQRELND